MLKTFAVAVAILFGATIVAQDKKADTAHEFDLSQPILGADGKPMLLDAKDKLPLTLRDVLVIALTDRPRDQRGNLTEPSELVEDAYRHGDLQLRIQTAPKTITLTSKEISYLFDKAGTCPAFPPLTKRLILPLIDGSQTDRWK